MQNKRDSYNRDDLLASSQGELLVRVTHNFLHQTC